jgi:hypothetical protein
VVAPASLHILTPGSPAYAVAKVGAIGGLFALRMVLTRRQRRQDQRSGEPSDSPAVPPAPERRRAPHPVSRKKRQRRRR